MKVIVTLPSIGILFMFCASQVLAQNTKMVSGQVIDRQKTVPLQYASVAIFDQQDNFITGSLADSSGRFILSGLTSGEYRIKVTFTGFSPFSNTLLVGEISNNYDLGKIFLEENVTELGGVTITAQRNEISAGMDKKSFSVENLITQSGGSLLDAMKTMPGVTVDQEGKIILRGSDKVAVLIDGKQSALTGFGNQKSLDNIPLANIESIEIINNPSARYDASGMAGIVNIIYKKEKEDGFKGSAGLAFGIGALTKPKDDLETRLGSYSPTPKLIPEIDLNYKKGRLGFFLQSEAYFQKALPNNEFTTRYYEDGRITASQVPENRHQNHFIFKGGVEYHPDESNTFTVSGIYDWERHQDTAQVAYINLLNNTRNRYINWHEDEITGFLNYSLKYEHKFPQPGHTMIATLQYTKNWEDETYYINDSSELRQGRDVTSVLGTEHIAGFNLDYTKPYKFGRLESGVKIQIRNLPVDYSIDRGENSIIFDGMGEWTKWGETSYAGYVNWVYEKSAYDIEGGLRSEYTSVFYRMDDANIYYPGNDSYDYLNLFPNIRLTWKINPNNRISLFHNRRIDRPGEPELRIFAKSDDHELLKVGNPYLRPQYTQTTEAAYKMIWKTGSVFLSLYYRYIKDPYLRVYTVDDSSNTYDIVIKTYANTGAMSNRGMELVLTQSMTPFWKLNSNVNLYANHIGSFTGKLAFPYNHEFHIEESNDLTWDFKISNTFKAGKNLELQLTGLYYAPKNIPQGKQLARHSIDIGLRYLILKGKGELRFSFSDIFNHYGIRQKIASEGFRAVYENNYETQIARIGVKMKF